MVARTLAKSVAKALTRSLLGASGGGAVDPDAAILALFANGEQGAWYDPSDFSTMFQDAAGTTPVTAVEQTVGLILDKRLGLERGEELVTNGDFSDGLTGWATFDAAVFTVVGGVLIATSSAVSNHIGSQSGTTAVVGKSYELTWTVISSNQNNALSVGGVATPYVNKTGQRRAIVTAISTGALQIYVGGATGSIEIDNISVRELPGNHAFQATAAARPVLKQDGSGKFYLQFDGVDDFLSTGIINFTSTDKMTVVAGYVAPSTATGMFLELSSNGYANDGGFYITDGEAVSGPGTYRNRGTIQAHETNLLSATPDSGVITVMFDNGAAQADQARIRINGADAPDTGGQATHAGNFGNYPLYIGSRAGPTLPFNGNLYQLVVRGAATADLAPIEAFTADKTGVTLP